VNKNLSNKKCVLELMSLRKLRSPLWSQNIYTNCDSGGIWMVSLAWTKHIISASPLSNKEFPLFLSRGKVFYNLSLIHTSKGNLGLVFPLEGYHILKHWISYGLLMKMCTDKELKLQKSDCQTKDANGKNFKTYGTGQMNILFCDKFLNTMF
jgi:hypothetical protein